MTATYVLPEPLALVRLLVGDTVLAGEETWQDEEVLAALALESGNIKLAAADLLMSVGDADSLKIANLLIESDQQDDASYDSFDFAEVAFAPFGTRELIFNKLGIPYDWYVH